MSAETCTAWGTCCRWTTAARCARRKTDAPHGVGRALVVSSSARLTLPTGARHQIGCMSHREQVGRDGRTRHRHGGGHGWHRRSSKSARPDRIANSKAKLQRQHRRRDKMDSDSQPCHAQRKIAQADLGILLHSSVLLRDSSMGWQDSVSAGSPRIRTGVRTSGTSSDDACNANRRTRATAAVSLEGDPLIVLTVAL